MYKTQRSLLALLAIFFSTTLFAQTIIDIEISGVDKPLKDNILLFLSVEQQKGQQQMNEGRLRRLHNKAPQEISKALQPFGYYRAVVDKKISKSEAGHWLLSYNIDTGPALRVAHFDFSISEEMRNDEMFQQLIDKHSLQEGSEFSHVDYENFKFSLAKMASERGYFDARFIEHRVEIDLDAYEVGIYLNYEGGIRYHFGEVLLDQNIIEHELLQRYIPFERGTPYTLDQLIELQQALNDSDYFQTVEVSPAKPLPGSNEIPIAVKLTPRKRHRFSFGLGYGTDTGARASFRWEMPRVNRHGHRFDTDARVSEIGYSLVAHYRVPILNPRTDQLIYTAGIVHETTDTTDSTLRTIGASLKRKRGDWRETVSLNYQNEDFIVADDSGNSILLIPSASWSRTWGDNFIIAFDGLRFDIGVSGASNQLISDASFSQLQGGIKSIHSLSQTDRFILRGNAGGTNTQEFHKLPTTVRFFAGGAQSVRGYAYNSLGPVDEDGKVVGGKYLLVGSAEFEHNFKNKWSVAVFYDVGNAIDNINDELATGAGFGFRWKSPVGPVRVDLASGLSLEGNPWRIHINIGPDL